MFMNIFSITTVVINKFVFLLQAVRRGHKQIVRFLLEHGANFSAQNNSGFSALTYAKMMRLTEIEDIIVDHITRSVDQTYLGQ